MSEKRKGWFGRKFIVAAVVTVLALGGYQLLYHPNTPLVDHWNPTKPLDARAPLTPLTHWKLARISNDRAGCRAALATISQYEGLVDKTVSSQCHIHNRVEVRNLANVQLRSTEMRCDLALKTAMWLYHGVQPAAKAHFNQPVRSVRTQGVYNCRSIAGTSRMSLHAQAKAIDVAGFTLADGREIELSRDWQGDTISAQFLRDVKDAACVWYKTTLSPDYNRAHHDHFHLQSHGWGTCR